MRGPALGDRVYLGVNAIVMGKIAAGDDALGGACSLVTGDVPPHTTVLGVPAVVLKRPGSSYYLVLDAGPVRSRPRPPRATRRRPDAARPMTLAERAAAPLMR